MCTPHLTSPHHTTLRNTSPHHTAPRRASTVVCGAAILYHRRVERFEPVATIDKTRGIFSEEKVFKVQRVEVWLSPTYSKTSNTSTKHCGRERGRSCAGQSKSQVDQSLSRFLRPHPRPYPELVGHLGIAFIHFGPTWYERQPSALLGRHG